MVSILLHLYSNIVMKCKECDSKLEYDNKYDAYYCPKCNKWTESKCNDEDCWFCSSRPETPMKMKKV